MTATQIREVQILSAPSALGAKGCPLVRVVSDSDGFGLGEARDGPPEEVNEIVKALSRLLVGRNPLDREAIWQAMCSAAGDWDGDPGLIAATLSGLDTAVWDLAAKQLDVPCGALMGGRTRSGLEICVDCGPVADEEAGAAAEALLESGVRSFTFELAAGDQGDLDRLRRLRRALGSEVLIIVRLTSPAQTTEEAISIGTALDRVDPYWIEGLLRDGRWDELARVRTAIASPVGAGASTIGARKFWRPLMADAADTLTPYIAFCGGLTGSLKLADLADARGVRASLSAGDTLVSALAAAHVSFARPNVSPLRVSRALLDTLLEASPQAVRDGFLQPSDAPGLGVDAAWLEARVWRGPLHVP